MPTLEQRRVSSRRAPGASCSRNMSLAIATNAVSNSGDESVAPSIIPSNSRERFLRACQSKRVDRPPVWLMRQAGRALPEYRELKTRFTFLEMVQTPALAAEVTLQPIRRFGFDAAILFSDILVIAEGLGQPYRFRETGGIEMEFALNSGAAISRLDPARVTERLQYAAEALKLIKKDLAGKTALLGFAGSPWTLANFMIEGGSAKEFTKAAGLFQADPQMFGELMEKLTTAVTDFLHLQIDAGADAVQIFDTLGGLLPGKDFEAASGRWIREITAGLKKRAPVIVFSKGMHDWKAMSQMGAQVLGVDWTVKLADVKAKLPKNIAVQGNLDPSLLTGPRDIVAAETTRILQEMKNSTGHIFNLGHGVPPDARLENIETLVATVRNFK